MPGRVPRRLQHAPDQRADLHHVALAHRYVDLGNLLRFLARRDDAAEVFLLQLGDAAGMIGVVMRHQNIGEAPAFLGERGIDRAGLGRIDRRRRPGRGVVQQDAVIVFQAGEEMGFGWHSSLAPPAWQRQAIMAVRWKSKNFGPFT